MCTSTLHITHYSLCDSAQIIHEHKWHHSQFANVTQDQYSQKNGPSTLVGKPGREACLIEQDQSNADGRYGPVNPDEPETRPPTQPVNTREKGLVHVPIEEQ
jgi:hypothetical protein